MLLERGIGLGQSGRRDPSCAAALEKWPWLGDSNERAQLGKMIALHHVDTHRLPRINAPLAVRSESPIEDFPSERSVVDSSRQHHARPSAPYPQALLAF